MISQWARSNLLHATSHWHVVNIKLWPQALDFAVWVYNRLLSSDTGLSPLEKWTQLRTHTNKLRRAHVFGCPVYVLDPTLQDGHKIPKCDPCSRLGIFVGFSSEHSSLVPLVLNTTTGKISPQFHVVFDDNFNTVPSLVPTQQADLWKTILTLYERDCFLDAEIDPTSNKSINPPPRFDWNSVLTPTHCDNTSIPYDSHTPTIPPTTHPTTPHPHNTQPHNTQHTPSPHIQPPPHQLVTPITPTAITADDTPLHTPPNNHIPHLPHDAPPIDTSSPAPEGAQQPTQRPRRNALTYKHGPAIARRLPITGEAYKLAYMITNGHIPATQSSNHCVTS